MPYIGLRNEDTTSGFLIYLSLSPNRLVGTNRTASCQHLKNVRRQKGLLVRGFRTKKIGYVIEVLILRWK